MARAIYIQLRGQRYIADMSADGHLQSLHLPGDYLEVPLSAFTEDQRVRARNVSRDIWLARQRPQH